MNKMTIVLAGLVVYANIEVAASNAAIDDPRRDVVPITNTTSPVASVFTHVNVENASSPIVLQNVTVPSFADLD